MKTMAEIKDELRMLKDDLYSSGENVDAKLVASYVDRLVLSLQDLCDSLEGMEASVENVCKCCEEMEAPKMSAPSPKPAKKKPAKKAKPAKKKKRR